MDHDQWGYELGRLAEAKANLRRILEARFGSLPAPLVTQLNSTDDLERLKGALLRAIQIGSLAEFHL
jgi:hypothetical protein